MTAAAGAVPGVRGGMRRRRWARMSVPYLLALVGSAWMVILFLIPLISGLTVSLMTGDVEQGYTLTWNFGIYGELFGPGADVPYTLFLGRALLYGATATLLTIAVGYPMAYYVAFRVRPRWKTPLLSLVLVSFLVSFIIRTDMWAFLLGGQGPLLSLLHRLGVGADFHILGTPAAVIGGLAYNSLPFMVLPIYVALERIDPRLFEAASDLYASPRSVFLRTTLPLSRSGIFSGILLVFIDCAGDPVNAQLLGGKSTYLIGQAIQDTYLTQQSYNVAAALSTVLMIALGVILFAYARVFGTDNIEDLV
jgi:spermidine/putrescine transport system permease protein